VPFHGGLQRRESSMASFTMSIQLELVHSHVYVVDVQPGDICTQFNDSVIKSTKADRRYDAKIARTWEIVERNIKNAPTPDLCCAACSQISQRCSSTAPDNGWRWHSNQKLRPLIFRFLPQRVRIWRLKKVLPYMTAICEAVILMAGEGSRLRGFDKTLLKPFVSVLGRPLIFLYDRCADPRGNQEGEFYRWLRKRSDNCSSQTVNSVRTRPCFIENLEWQNKNGISLLAAANDLTSPFLLTMSDHLFDQSIVGLLLRNAVLDQLNSRARPEAGFDLRYR